MLVDSTVIIDYLRGEKKAKNFLEDYTKPLTVSVIVVMEIVAGLNNRKNIKDFFLLLSNLNIEVIQIIFSISQKALDLFIQYKEKGIGMADCFIAATAIEEKQKLATHNLKHFSLIRDLEVSRPY